MLFIVAANVEARQAFKTLCIRRNVQIRYKIKFRLRHKNMSHSYMIQTFILCAKKYYDDTTNCDLHNFPISIIVILSYQKNFIISHEKKLI